MVVVREDMSEVGTKEESIVEEGIGDFVGTGQAPARLLQAAARRRPLIRRREQRKLSSSVLHLPCRSEFVCH